jgi:AcrR family transcriptional regulator
MARARNPELTRGAILAAARTEFAAHGFAGGRTDSIAAAAGVNKRMLYHYFASKEGLYAAVLADRLGRYIETEPGDSLLFQLEQRVAAVQREPDDLRLLMWEALTGAAPDVVTDVAGGSYWRERIDGHRAAQRDGRLAAEFDPAQLELALTALTIFPVAFAEVARAITGAVPGASAFDSAYREFLVALAERLMTATTPEQPTTAGASNGPPDMAEAARGEANVRTQVAAGPRKPRVRLTAATVNRAD